MRTEHLNVTGMSCGGCVINVTKALNAVDGIDNVSVSLDQDEATVCYDDYVTTKALLKSAVFARIRRYRASWHVRSWMMRPTVSA